MSGSDGGAGISELRIWNAEKRGPACWQADATDGGGLVLGREDLFNPRHPWAIKKLKSHLGIHTITAWTRSRN